MTVDEGAAFEAARDEVPETQDMRPSSMVVQCMIDLGGGFASQLGRTFLNANDRGYFWKEMVVTYGNADSTNRKRIEEAFPEFAALMAIDRADLFARLHAAFKPEWDRYATMVPGWLAMKKRDYAAEREAIDGLED